MQLGGNADALSDPFDSFPSALGERATRDQGEPRALTDGAKSSQQVKTYGGRESRGGLGEERTR